MFDCKVITLKDHLIICRPQIIPEWIHLYRQWISILLCVRFILGYLTISLQNWIEDLEQSNRTLQLLCPLCIQRRRLSCWNQPYNYWQSWPMWRWTAQNWNLPVVPRLKEWPCPPPNRSIEWTFNEKLSFLWGHWKCGSGKRGTRMQGWKKREVWKVWKAKISQMCFWLYWLSARCGNWLKCYCCTKVGWVETTSSASWRLTWVG